MSKDHDYNEDELAMLDEHERAAIEGGDDDGADDGDDGQGDGAENGKDNNDDGAEHDDGSDDDGSDDPGADAGADGNGSETDDKAPAAQPAEEQDPLAELNEKITGIDTQLTELGQQFEDGEIDFQDYHKKLNELNNQRFDAREQINRVQIRQEIRQEENARQFEAAKTKFFADEANAVFANNEIAAVALATAFKKVNADPAFASKGYFDRMQEAKQQLVSQGFFGAQPKADGDGKKPNKRDNGIDKVPQTLANLPAADSNDGSKYTHLDNLDGLELEEALARMPQEEQDRYLKG